MHTLVLEASDALAQNDPEKLEDLAIRARGMVCLPGGSLTDLAHATELLTARLSALKSHLALYTHLQQNDVHEWRGETWER